MADNVPITAGSGTTVSTEEVTTLNGGAVTAQHVQRVATAFRTADGVASDAATGAGAVAAGVQRTTLASDDPAVAALGATNSSAAANPSATAGLNGVIKGMWTGLVAGIGAIGDTAWVSGSGSVIAILKNIATAAADTTTPVPTYGTVTYVDVTVTLDTSAYASGDVLFATTVITNLMRANDIPGVLQSVSVIDKADQKPAFDIYFHSSNVAMGTFNAAPSITDANAASIMGPPVSIAAADYKDLGGVSINGKDGIGKTIIPASGTRNVYMSGILTAGTPTFTASDLVLRIGVVS